MSQNFDIGPGLDFMSKNGKVFFYFCVIIFLDFVKSKLGPEYKI